MILIDTNILVYAINTDSPRHFASKAMLDGIQQGKIRGALFPQNLLEFFAIVTDHRRIERPLEVSKALEVMDTLQHILPVLDAGNEALNYLAEAIRQRTARKTGVFDVWLVAQMQALGLDTICTYNTRDFTGYSAIRPVTPEELLADNL